MKTREIDEAMERSINGDHEGAMEIFRNGDMVADYPEAISYYALSTAGFYKNHRKGLALCVNALKRDVKNPVIYRNLGKIFLMVGERGRAYSAFNKGLSITGERDEECSREITVIGVRRTPVLSFLKRGNFLNVALGKFTSTTAG